MKNKKDNRLTTAQMMGYGSGDFAIELVINSVIFYLLYYYTDVFLIPSAIAGTIILVSRLLQAMMNPIVGLLSDKTETRWGKKRPFILFTAVPLGLFFFLVFAPAGILTDYKLVYAFISSILFLAAFSFTAIPYTSLASVITHDSRERSLVSAWRMGFALMGSLVAAGATRPLASLFENEAVGFRVTSLLYGILVVIILLITFSSTSEKRIVKTGLGPVAGFKDFALIRKNGPFLLIAISSLFFYMALNTLAATVNYYFKYVLNAEHLIAVAFVALFATAGLAIPLFIAIAEKWGKKNAFLSAAVFFFLVLMTSFFAGIQGIKLTLVILVLSGVGISGIFLFPWSLMPDTVEYMQWKTGVRREGMLYGFFILFFNSSAAMAGLVTGMGLDLSGYIPNVAQDVTAKHGIFLLMTIVPAVSILIGSVLLYFYPIDEEMHLTMVREIRERENKQ